MFDINFVGSYKFAYASIYFPPKKYMYTTAQMFGVSRIFFFGKELILWFSKDIFNLSKLEQRLDKKSRLFQINAVLLNSLCILKSWFFF